MNNYTNNKQPYDQDLSDELDSMLSEIDKRQEEERNKFGKKSKDVVTANFENLCDLVLDENKVKFLTMEGELLEAKEIDGVKNIPPTLADLDFLLPDGNEVIVEARNHKVPDATDDTDDWQGCPYCLKLFEELKKYHEEISELPKASYYDLLALWDFHSHLIEKFNFSPIIYFFADKERGKTRTAKGLIYVSRRGVMTETLREANLIRWGRDHKSTLLFDLKNFAKKLESSQTEDLVYGRVERGVSASRVLFPEKGAFRDTVRFEVFGATVVTSNRMIDDIGASRTITIDMKPSIRVFGSEPTREESLPLKTKLTGMRLAHLNQNFYQSPKTETGRLEDMLIGYLRMIKTLFPSLEEKYKTIKLTVKGENRERSGDSFEAQILQIILNSESLVEAGSVVLPYEEISNKYNLGKRENLHLDGRALSRITKGMGFDSKRNSDGTKRGIPYNTELINRLKIIYGLDDIEVTAGIHPPASSASSEPSERTGNQASDADIDSIFGVKGKGGDENGK